MDAAELEELLSVFEKSLSLIKWRLKPSSKSRLQTDILALCSRMRPCIMVDYGGKMPELGDHLSAFLKHCKKVRALTDFIGSSLSMETETLFVDLEIDPPKIMTQAEKSPAMLQLLSAQKLFSSVFHADGMTNDHLQKHTAGPRDGDVTSQSSEIVDLSLFLQESQVTIPTLNGWLLGYPVIYLFGKDYIERAICNLSTKSLHIYQIFVTRVNASSKGQQKEELMSFTVPYELSLEESNEAWAQSFLAQMQQRWENCKHVWGSLNMEVSGCYPQSIAL